MANINPEDKMLNLHEETEFLEEYTRTEYDTLRPAYGDCDFDMDNYGYDYW